MNRKGLVCRSAALSWGRVSGRTGGSDNKEERTDDIQHS